MELSRLILNPRSRDVHRDLADVQNMHRSVMSVFPQAPAGEEARAHFGVLFRPEVTPRTGIPYLLVQSRVQPDWSSLPKDYLLDTHGAPANPEAKPVDAAYANLRDGMALAFRVRANPTRKVDTKTGPDGVHRNGRRVKLIGREEIGDGKEVTVVSAEEEQLAWLARKGEDHGFRLAVLRKDEHGQDIPDVRVHDEGQAKGGWRQQEEDPATSRLTFGTVLFEGMLEVTDAGRFRQTLELGIGPGKAYGCGLLSIRPWRHMA